MIAPGQTWRPTGLVMMRTGLEVIAVKLVEATAAQAEFLSGGFGFDMAGSKVGQHVTDERIGTTMCQLLFFIAADNSRAAEFLLQQCPNRRTSSGFIDGSVELPLEESLL